MATERQIIANRQNAQKSTGPKTTAGKLTSSKNAITHGLLAREAFIDRGQGAENRSDFEALIEGLMDYYQPLGTMEELLVQEIVSCLWRKRRIPRQEIGLLHAQVDRYRDEYFASFEKVNNVRAEKRDKVIEAECSFEGLCDPQFSDTEMVNPNHPDTYFEPYDVRRYLNELVEEYRENQKNEQIPSGANAKESYAFLIGCGWTEPELRMSFGRIAEGDLEEAQRKMTSYEEFWGGDELSRMFQLRSLPPAHEIETLLRYESHVNNALYKAMHELERLQRVRSGLPVAPPITVELNGDKA